MKASSKSQAQTPPPRRPEAESLPPVLIADDDLVSRLMLSGVLRQAGHEVIATANGTDALAILLQKAAPRLAILDWMMPGLDGPEVVRQARRHLNDRPPHLILLTTRGEKADVASGLKAGADDYMTKPFDLGELRARIEVGRRMLWMRDQLQAQIVDLRNAVEQIATLQGLLPICSHCKSIRDDKGYWKKVETYMSEHAGISFTHGVCPTCMATEYPELNGTGHTSATARIIKASPIRR